MPADQIVSGVLVGTAGHVDHGKTTLIHAMTGINTDRLKEEQERGLTIDLGFAHLKLPSGLQIGIVDVPGHERFLKNMLAGAGGIDVAMLVIAADEGIMPQTREHLEILQLLRTRKGLVALTKCDTVDPDWLEMVIEDIAEYLSGSFLADAPILPVSGVTGEGINNLISELDHMASTVVRKRTDGPFRMPVDRVFTVRGFGTVVTGTVASGTIRTGESLSVLPGKMQSKARGIEVHGAKTTVAPAGTRAAINLAGIEHADITRGFVVVTPGYLGATTCFDAYIDVLASAPRGLKPRTRVRVHTGTSEILGRTYPLGTDLIAPDQGGFIQIRLESSLVVGRGDRFVVRLYSPTVLLGGGEILEPSSTRHKRSDKSVLNRLNRALTGEPSYITEDVLAEAPAGMSRDEIIKKTALTPLQVDAALNELISSNTIFSHGKRLLHKAGYDGTAESVVVTLEGYHAKYRARIGMPREELRTQLGSRWDQKSYQSLLEIMVNESSINLYEDKVSLFGHTPTLTATQQEASEKVLGVLLFAGANPPSEEELLAILGESAPEVMGMLVASEKVIKVTDGMFFHAAAIEDVRQKLIEHLAGGGEITVSAFRDLIGSSRKYAVPLMEYMDSKKITRRQGDVRVLY